jgi:uncharacterized membrane protein
MTSLICAALFFVGIHLLISGTPLRTALVGRLGEKPYQGFFSLLSAAALTWLIWAFSLARVPAPTGLQDYRWLAAVLNLIAFILIVFGVTSRTPTIVGGEGALQDAEPAKGMQRITRHAMLWGVAVWAATHMLFNPQPAVLWFFGAFLALSVIGPPSIDAKRARAHGAAWQSYLQKTSNIPFLAILQGRNRLALAEILDWRLLLAAVSFLLFARFHARFFGLPAF